MATSVATAAGAATMGLASAQDDDTRNVPWVDGGLKRFATTAFGAEVTGPFVTETNELIFSLQHPSRDNPAPFDKGGVVEGYQFDHDGSNNGFEELAPPRSDEPVRVRCPRLADSDGEQPDGVERDGAPRTPGSWRSARCTLP